METTLATEMLRADAAAIASAAHRLWAGGLVAFPTETVYGLGADAANARAVARLYAAKGRPAFNPLIAHVADARSARKLARFDAAAERLAELFWPGPLTLVLPKAEGCPVADLATAGLETVAVRVPAHPVARALLSAFGGPVVAPSANRSGHVSPTAAEHVRSDLFGRIDMILDAGRTDVGLESTILACLDEGPSLLRPGGLAREVIEEALGARLAASSPVPGPEHPLAPGQLASHYAPSKPLRLEVDAVWPGEALLAFGPSLSRGAEAAILILNLSEIGDLGEAAANLFSHLRALDGSQASAIAAMPVPAEGLGAAINDRLRRAAAPRRTSRLLYPEQDR